MESAILSKHFIVCHNFYQKSFVLCSKKVLPKEHMVQKSTDLIFQDFYRIHYNK